MAVSVTGVALDAFRLFAALPENEDRSFELIKGEIVEKSPSRTSNSWIGNLIVAAVHSYCRAHQLQFYTTSGDSTYLINGFKVPLIEIERSPAIGNAGEYGVASVLKSLSLGRGI